jgi:hypothetical protein
MLRAAMTPDEAEQMRRNFNSAINFAITTDDPKAFLITWREGAWDTLREEWPDFELPPMAALTQIFYMRDNHTFQPLPLDVAEAESVLRQEFESGYTHGMLCSKSPGMETSLHAGGRAKAEEFFIAARQWVQRAIDLEKKT